MTFPYHLWGCQTNAGEDTRSLSIQQQVCSHSDGIEVERWSASFMKSFQPEQNLSLSTITNLILLYINTAAHHVSLGYKQWDETTSCPTQMYHQLYEVTFYLPVCDSIDILQELNIILFFQRKTVVISTCAQCLAFFAMILALIQIIMFILWLIFKF